MKVECPHCHRWGEWEDNFFRPFCSERCKMVDLGKWALEEYSLSGSEDETEAASSGELDDSESENKSE
jgi:uncharacterized protein